MLKLFQILQYIKDHSKELLVAVIAFYIFVKLLDIILQWITVSSHTVTILHKERVFYPKKLSSFYVIYTDKGAFKVKDTIAFLRFDASNRYTELNVGFTYEVVTTGYRSTLWSEYPNIIKVK